jgi:hypothetical protein
MVKKFLVIILHFSIHGSKERLLDAVNISPVDVVNILDSYTQKDHSNKSSSENEHSNELVSKTYRNERP